MSNDDSRPASEPPVDARPVIPVDAPVVPDYFTPGDTRLVTLRRMPLMEAEMARAKLESEGVPCAILDQEIAVNQPLVFSEVKLQVKQSDVELAEQILAQPAGDDDGEYVEEAWRCPQCHRKTLELMPLSPGRRRVRTAFFTLLVMWPLLGLSGWIIPELGRWIDNNLPPGLFVLWFVGTVIFGLMWILAHRSKRCTKCGWQST